MAIKTTDYFSPNRMMPIPPTLKPVVPRSIVGPESEHLTLIGQAINRNTEAPPTVRSMPTVTPNMMRAYNKKNQQPLKTIQESNPTIKNLTAILGNQQTTLTTADTPHISPTIHTVREVKKAQSTNSAFQKFMIRFVIGLAVVAVVLTILVFAISLILS
jgi:hypothetical protein